MKNIQYTVLLADDDADDCIFFQEAVEELQLPCTVSVVNNGAELMDWLNKNNNLPDLLFLDLNMPYKNGMECLSEIKLISRLQELPVVIFSTSMDDSMIDLLYEKGANCYVRKPGDFRLFRESIHSAVSHIELYNKKQPAKENFVLQYS